MTATSADRGDLLSTDVKLRVTRKDWGLLLDGDAGVNHFAVDVDHLDPVVLKFEKRVSEDVSLFVVVDWE